MNFKRAEAKETKRALLERFGSVFRKPVTRDYFSSELHNGCQCMTNMDLGQAKGLVSGEMLQKPNLLFCSDGTLPLLHSPGNKSRFSLI